MKTRLFTLALIVPLLLLAVSQTGCDIAAGDSERYRAFRRCTTFIGGSAGTKMSDCIVIWQTPEPCVPNTTTTEEAPDAR